MLFDFIGVALLYFLSIIGLTEFYMTKFYFLQEAIAAGPIMLFLFLLLSVAIITALVIIAVTLKKIKRVSLEYKVDGNKKYGTFIIVNFTIAVILLLGVIMVLYKISSITFD